MIKTKNVMLDIVNMTRDIADIEFMAEDTFRHMFSVSNTFIKDNKIQLNPMVFSVADVKSGKVSGIFSILRKECNENREKIKQLLRMYAYKYENNMPKWLNCGQVEWKEGMELLLRNSFYQYTFLCDDVIDNDFRKKYGLTDFDVLVLAKAHTMFYFEYAALPEYQYMLQFINNDAIGGFIRHLSDEVVEEYIESVMLKIDYVKENVDLAKLEFVNDEVKECDGPIIIQSSKTPFVPVSDMEKFFEIEEECECEVCEDREAGSEFLNEVVEMLPSNLEPCLEIMAQMETVLIYEYEEEVIDQEIKLGYVVQRQQKENCYSVNKDQPISILVDNLKKKVILDKKDQDCHTFQMQVFGNTSFSYFDVFIQEGYRFDVLPLVCKDWYNVFYKHHKFAVYDRNFFPVRVEHPLCVVFRKKGFIFNNVIVSSILWDTTMAINTTANITSFLIQNCDPSFNCTIHILLYCLNIISYHLPTCYYAASLKRLNQIYFNLSLNTIKQTLSTFKIQLNNKRMRSVVYTLRDRYDVACGYSECASGYQTHYQWNVFSNPNLNFRQRIHDEYDDNCYLNKLTMYQRNKYKK